ncbi:MAG: GlsB/YeaQ/YmgE family stress response membrane protein [Chloroflexi bacterium]|nr:GlsB/YeaQ/YmgE family stress response membrane protein [Chloroflexota bacterium]
MGILGWIVLGALAGWVASIIVGTNRQQGLLRDILLGIGGAVVGGLVMNLIGGHGVTGINLPSFLVALGGAIVLLLLFGRKR